MHSTYSEIRLNANQKRFPVALVTGNSNLLCLT